MTSRRTDSLDRVLEDFERLVELGGRVERVRTTLQGIVQRRREGPTLGSTIELVEVSPGVYQSARAPSRTQAALEDVRSLRDALRPEIPDAIVTRGRRR